MAGRRVQLVMILLALASGSIILAVCQFARHGQAQQLDFDVQSIVDELRARQASVFTLSYTWVSKQLYVKGSIEIPNSRGTSEVVRYPDKDTVVESTYSVIIDGQKYRRDEHSVMWSSLRGGFGPHNNTLAFVNGTSRGYYSHGHETRGFVGKDFRDPEMFEYYPIFMAYRLFDSLLGYAKPEELSFVARASHEGHPCVILQKCTAHYAYGQTLPQGERYWLAEDQDYSIVRWEAFHTNGGQLSNQLDMRYEYDEEMGWILKSWEAASFTIEGKLKSPSWTSEAVVACVNDPVDAEDFEIVFPTGTHVRNSIAGTEYVAGEGGN